MSESHGFDRLHEGVRRWVWKQKWNALRKIQEKAIDPILKADCDVIISASTAAGKTEAAFLPACSRIANDAPKGIGILYISPLKTLINDQHRRLQSLGEILDIPVTPWHGDVLQSVKNKQRKNPYGILLITPESLEALFLNQAGWCTQAFVGLSYIIVDEFHAFLGTERGCQLRSLMHRLEFLLKRTIPRIALSATLGEMQPIAHYLRPNKELPSVIIDSVASHSDLKIQLRGYLDPASMDAQMSPALDAIMDDLYEILRGKSHLIFANSRRRTEEITAGLSDRCDLNGAPNEFFAHHGNLSKDIRESLEVRLQGEKLPTTAVCTMTLELGIDIGNVDSIAQVTATHSVASLRQRLGRSGRRGEAAVLRMFIAESELTVNSHLLDRLRLQTIQCIAMVNLLLKKWYEPAPEKQYHLSTLVQQTLSVIGQYGGVRANQLWQLLCGAGGPFALVDEKLYATFLRALGKQEVITQLEDGQITLGRRGEKMVEHYTFYAAFNTPEEYRLECDGRVLGTVPIDKPLWTGQIVIFGGKHWEVLNVIAEKKLVLLRRATGGNPPIFGGDGQAVHDIVRQEMLRVYRQGDAPIYLDKAARLIFDEGIEDFHTLGLDKRKVLKIGNTVHILSWMGDRIVTSITALLRREGLGADCFAGVIDIRNCSIDSFHQAVDAILQGKKPSPLDLASSVQDTIVEKHDPILPKELRDLGYGVKFFDINGAWQWLSNYQDK